MKRLAFLILVVISVKAYAQPSNVVSAWNYLKSGELDKAKNMIDPAILHEKTKTWSKTWYYRGLIYYSMYGNKDYGKLDPNPLQVAYESFKKSIEIEPKGDYADDIKLQMKKLTIQFFNAGLGEFSKKNYDNALNYFADVLSIDPTDTVAILNSAITATRAGKLDKAIEFYNTLIKMKYNDSKVFGTLANIYIQQKDTAKYFEVIEQGRKQYPDSLDLLKLEINYFLITKKSDQAIDRINIALQKSPKDNILWFALGNIYDKLASENYEAGKTTEQEANFAKAESAYKKAIEIKPDYFDAYFDLGAMYFNLAAAMIKKANDIDASNIKAYNDAKEKFDGKLKQAQPYLEKALELQPKDEGTLSSLKQLYAHLGLMDKSNEMKKRMDELNK
jgi:tetratricopeptide (TPR) repeat protein